MSRQRNWILKVFLNTLGCRLNESEIEQMGRLFRHLGHDIVESVEDAELCVINTCAVTNEAGRKSRQLIYQASRKAPDAKIFVTGCYSEIEREKVEEIPGVVDVISNMEKDSLVPKVLQLEGKEAYDLEPLLREIKPGEIGRTRAFIKAQDGCDNRCTFCVTTIARGAGRSRPLREIISEVNGLYDAGYQEAVLSGVHLGSYGRDLQEESDLKILVKALLDETDMPRIRLSSLEPWDIPEGFFTLWEDERLCRHIHLPLQAGCDATLKRMARRTRKSAFRGLVEESRSLIPGLAISSDMIVGFPGETDAEFEETVEFVKEMDFCHMHVFRYSARPGTAAARMPNQVHGNTRAERSAVLQEIARTGRLSFYEQQLGKSVDVLWEQMVDRNEKGFLWQGLTDHYVRVQMRVPRNLHNLITPVTLQSFTEDQQALQAVFSTPS
ncbi:MAG TPA: tRNA (N(6)-L-threonylcarbamoyladenosine(37)-C(2))-methylthiotransferase MtaB [Myxococcales bacterium]|nr:tRNA (N(6)-L-threonylcarbamoyladenosine(37)-C(2))-methylthiotransferase MtaB [Myxococcales bacterium]